MADRSEIDDIRALLTSKPRPVGWQRQRIADVPVTLEIWPHMIHGSPLWNPGLGPGQQALARLGRFTERLS